MNKHATQNFPGVAKDGGPRKALSHGLRALFSILVTLIPVLGGTLCPAPASAAEAGPDDSDEVFPLIVIDGVPLCDSVRNLARVMKMNFIFDPRVPGSGFEPGKSLADPLVSIRMENCSAGFALGVVLMNHKLKLVTNGTTSVIRIAPENDLAWTVLAPALTADTNKPVARLVFDETPLRDAMEIIARRIPLKLSFDAKDKSSILADPDALLSIRWNNITPRQALAALCDNFGIEMIEQTSTSTARISMKARHDGLGENNRH